MRIMFCSSTKALSPRGIRAQIDSSSVPRFSVTVEPALGNRANEEPSGREVQVLGRAMFQSLGSVGFWIERVEVSLAYPAPHRHHSRRGRRGHGGGICRFTTLRMESASSSQLRRTSLHLARLPRSPATAFRKSCLMLRVGQAQAAGDDVCARRQFAVFAAFAQSPIGMRPHAWFTPRQPAQLSLTPTLQEFEV
jgi:hypothetical protein